MHVAQLALTDFRSYAETEMSFDPGVNLLLGANGAGKTNLLEAIGYVATLGSHRVATTAPLVRAGADRAIVRAAIVRDDREVLVELELVPGRTGRARLGRAPVPRPREVLGVLRTVLFAPEDLGIVKGDPGNRRAFLDDLLVARAPRFAGVRADYDRVLRQRNALLKSASLARRNADLSTLDVWDMHLARTGAELLSARLDLLDALRPLVDKAYAAVAPAGGVVSLGYVSSLGPPAQGQLLVGDRDQLVEALRQAALAQRPAELERGVSLVGPHRDELVITLAQLPARGYASQGESWSIAMALRLASYDLLRADGGEPVLLLDDVFAELDETRRDRLAELVAPAEQVVISAAVAADVPKSLSGRQYLVGTGEVTRVG
jgi:DNA replication and repair protein RecF